MSKNAVHRRFVDTPEGQIHYAAAGQGRAILLLHQTPRSWDEYREVLPLLGAKYRAIAMDTIGFGDSYRPKEKGSIEAYAKGVIRFMDAMEIDRAFIIGHHTGGVIALEVAATYPRRVRRLVLSSTPYVDAEDRKRRQTRPPIDEVKIQPDGSHLTDLWQKRMAFYPKDRPDLLTRFVIDALKTGERREEGHQAVGAYRMEHKVGLIKVPTLVMCGANDPFAFPCLKLLADRIKGCQTAVIEGGMVPMVDQMPQAFAKAVIDFLESS